MRASPKQEHSKRPQQAFAAPVWDGSQLTEEYLRGPLYQDTSNKPTRQNDLLSAWQLCQNGVRSYSPNGFPRFDIYYMGVIDILQEFDLRKRLESTYKGIRFNKNAISAVASKRYAERMILYLDEHTE